MATILKQLDAVSDAPKQDFVRLVRDAGSEEPKISLQEAESILDRARKTSDDLQAAIALLHQRQEWNSQLDREEEAKDRVTEIDRECKRRQERFEEVRRKHSAELNELRAEQTKHQAKVLAAVGARSFLLERHYDESLGSRLADMAKRRKNVAPSFNNVCERLQRKSDRLKELEEAKEAGGLVAEGYHELREVGAEVKSLTEQRAELREQLDAINREAEQLDSLRLEP